MRGRDSRPERGDLFSELKRRKVYRVAVAYLALALGALEGAGIVFPVLGLGPAVFNGLVILALVGFPVAVGLAWTFDVTPEGIRRTDPGGPGAPVQQGPDRWVRLKAAFVGAGFVLVAWAGLRLWQSPGSGGPIVDSDEPFVAVLPFEDLSPGGDQSYFVDGLHAEVLHQLAKVPGIRVKSGTSVERFRDTSLGASAIADSLGARYVLTASVRTAGDSLYFNVHLIDGPTDAPVWSESLPGSASLEGLFSLQRTLATRIAGALGGTLGADSGVRIGRLPTSSLEAYHAYLRGLHGTSAFDVASWWNAIDHFERAVELDPDFGRAHARLAQVLGWVNNYGLRSQGELFPRMREHAEAAMRLIPDEPLGHIAMVSIHWPIDWDWEAAREDMERALELDPDFVDALWYLAEWWGVIAGNTDRGLEYLQRASEVDPFSLQVETVRMWVLMNGRRFEEAVVVGQRVLELNPNNASLALSVVFCLGMLDRRDEARGILMQMVEAIPAPLPPVFVPPAVQAGEEELAREILRSAVALKESGGEVPSSAIAAGYAALREVGVAMDWLERSFEEEGGIYYLRHADWDNVAQDPRFQAIWDRVGLHGRHSSLTDTPSTEN